MNENLATSNSQIVTIHSENEPQTAKESALGPENKNDSSRSKKQDSEDDTDNSESNSKTDSNTSQSNKQSNSDTDNSGDSDSENKDSNPHENKESDVDSDNNSSSDEKEEDPERHRSRFEKKLIKVHEQVQASKISETEIRQIVDKQLDTVTIVLVVCTLLSMILGVAIMEKQYADGLDDPNIVNAFCPGSNSSSGGLCPGEQTSISILKGFMTFITVIMLGFLWRQRRLRYFMGFPELYTESVCLEFWNISGKVSFYIEVVLIMFHSLPRVNSLWTAVSFVRVYLLIGLLRFYGKVRDIRLLQIESGLKPGLGMWIAMKIVLRSAPWKSISVFTLCLIPIFSYINYTMARVADDGIESKTAIDSMFEISMLFAVADGYDAEGVARIAKVINGLAATAVATMLFAGLQTSLELTENQEAAMNSVLLQQLENEVRENAARIIWHMWKWKRLEKAGMKDSQKAKKKRAKIRIKFRKRKTAYLDLKEKMDKELGVVPVILSAKSVCSHNTDEIELIENTITHQFQKILINQRELRVQGEVFRKQTWDDKVTDIMTKLDQCMREQNGIESRLLQKVDEVEKQLTEKQQHISKQLIMIGEEQKRNVEILNKQLKDLAQQEQKITSEYNHQIIAGIDLTKNIISDSQNETAKAEVSLSNQLKLISEQQENSMTRLMSQLEEIAQQQQNIAESNKKKISAKIDSVEKNSILINQQKGIASEKDRRAIVEGIKSLNEAILKNSEKNDKATKDLLEHAKRQHANRKKEHTAVKDSIESLKIKILENREENAKAMKSLSDKHDL